MAVAARRVPVALPFRQVRQVGRRLTWGIADQAMCNLTNFLLSIYIVRTLGAAQFGAFSLAYVTYGFAINASRGLSIEPLLIRFSGTDPSVWRRAAAGCSGTALLVGVASGLLALAAGAVVGGTTGLAFLGLGLTLPGLLLQDSWRYSFFAQARGRDAFINDTLWAVIQIPLMVLLKMTGHANVFWFVIAWGAGAAVGAVLGSVQARVIPSLVSAREWLITHRDLGPRYLAENTGGNAASSLQSYGVSWILGIAAVGYIQAANTLMGPFRVIFFGMGMITIPEAAGILRRSPRKLPAFCAALSVGLTLLAAVWGAGLLVAMPLGLGHLLLGNIWRSAYPLVLPATIAIAAMCFSTGAGTGLHALGAARRSLRATLLSSLVIVVLALVGALVGGTLGTMRFAAIGTWLGALLSWWQLRQAFIDTPRVGMPTWLLPPSAGRHHRPPAADSRRYRRHVRRTVAAESIAAGSAQDVR